MEEREAKLDLVQEEEGVPAVLSLEDEVLDIVDKARQRIEAIKQIKTLALGVTSPEDWVDQNGVPYLEASGAEKIARLFGISWYDLRYEKKPMEDGHYTIVYYGKFSLRGITIEAIGARSSRDPFFTVRYDEKGNRILLPAKEVNEADVMKAAYTNLLANGIKRLLGIRNVSWEDLEQVGIRRDKVASVKYTTRKRREKREAEGPEAKPKNWKEAFVATVRKFRAKLGDDSVNAILERFGYDSEEGVTSYDEAKQIYEALKEEEKSLGKGG